MSALRRLAERAGILTEYHDIWGNGHATSDDTRRALLGAMGLLCSDEAACEATLEAWKERDWRRHLPPVLVVPSASPIRVPVCLPARQAGMTWSWRVFLEDGARREGRFEPERLETMASARIDNEDWHSRDLDLSGIEQTGYHRLEIAPEDGAEDGCAAMALIVCPPRCHRPEAIHGDKRVWGVTAQIYGVRSIRNWGMGDFTDLLHLVEWAAQAGASLVGINPLHALFPHNPNHASPYSPSSRRFLNTLYLDVESIPEFNTCDEARTRVSEADFQAKLRVLRAADLVDYTGVAAAKSEILAMLHRHFLARHQDDERVRAFRAWRELDGAETTRFARYQALQEHFHARDPALWGWPVWPEAYRDPGSLEVATFADEHAERVDYFLYLQWLAETQLDRVSEHSTALGLGIGLYRDLAVGVDLGGAETWSQRETYALDARVGSPPDDFNLQGQDWGLPPWIPHRLREAGYAPFIAMLRANMRGAGALRLDHVMGLMRLYWVPPGMRGDQGAYVAYPFQDLLGILALESRRNHCLVVGEDLGTVPDAVRSAMAERDILSYRLFYFEREHDGAFRAPSCYPEAASVAVSTHDLPTLAGYWRGRDLELRAGLGQFPDKEELNRQTANRAMDRERLLAALRREGVLPEGFTSHPADMADMDPALILATYRYLARAPAKLALAQAEDMLGETEQANLPGTIDGHPNWRRKLSQNLESWQTDPRVAALAEAMSDERGGPPARNA